MIRSLIILCFLFAPASGATYYASTSGSGSSCSLASPCSIQTLATTACSADDIGYLRGGTYNFKLTFACSGTSGHPIVIRSYPGELAVIDGYLTTTLNGAISNSQTTLTLTDGTKFPAGTFVIIDQEVIYLETKSSTNVASLANRNQGGTDGGAASHSSGAIVRIGYAPQITINGDNVALRDLEILSSDPQRSFSRTLSDPSVHRGQGVQVASGADNVSIINCKIHDNRDGIYGQSDAKFTRIAGNWFCSNGFIDAARGHGQTIYLQNDGTSTKTVYGNVSCNGFAEGMEAFGQSGPVKGVTFDSNISFNAGSPNQYVGNPAGQSLTAGQANIFVGSSADPIDAIIVRNNVTYHRASITGGNLFLGSGTDNLDISVTNNFALGGVWGLIIKLWKTAVVTGNTSWSSGSSGSNSSVIENNQAPSPGAWTSNNNTFWESNTGTANLFKWNSSGFVTFAAYKAASGQDASSVFTATAPATGIVQYFPNADIDAYSRIAGFVAIHNPTAASTVNVTLSSAGLTNGDSYQIYKGDDMGGSPLASGTYTSGAVSVSMTNTTVTPPIGHSHTPASCGPDFVALVVIRTAQGGSSRSAASGRTNSSGRTGASGRTAASGRAAI